MRFNIFKKKKKKRTLTEEELQYIKEVSEKARKASDEEFAKSHQELMDQYNNFIGSFKQLDKLYPVQSPLTALLNLVSDESQRHLAITLPCIDEKTGKTVQKYVVDPECPDAKRFPQMYHILKLRPVNPRVEPAPAFPPELYGVLDRVEKLVAEYCRICETEGANHPYKIAPSEIIVPLIKEHTPKDAFSQTVRRWFLGEINPDPHKNDDLFLAWLKKKSKEQSIEQ